MKNRPRKHPGNGQVTLEFAFAMVIVLLLFWAAVAIFLYVNNRLVIRQQYYESSPECGREIAADTATNWTVEVNEDELANLDFFKNF